MAEQLARIEDYITQQLAADPPPASHTAPVTTAQDLRELVSTWCLTLDKIKRMSRITRSLNILRKDYEGKILTFMSENDIEELTTQHAVIQCVSSKPRRATVRTDGLEQLLPDPDLRDRVVAVLGNSKSNSSKAPVKLRRLTLT